jgi:transketolase
MLNSNLHLNPYIFLHDVEKKATRYGYGEAVVFAAEENRHIVVLCADLTESTKSDLFEKRFPDRFIEMGIAEQNMAGVAAGLALAGKVPFMASYAIFSPGRNWEQIRLSICFSNANVKIIASHAGLSACFDGGMTQCLEDIALTRVLPNMLVINPIDYAQTKKATHAIAQYKGPCYLRLCREATPLITTENTPFEIGKAQVMAEGDDITIAGTGPIMYDILLAAKELKAVHKVNVEVLSVPTIKPLDTHTILQSVKKTKCIITVEDHSTTAGFGSAVAEMLSDQHPTPQKRIGVNDKFGESGKYSELKDKFGISSHHIIKEALNLLKTKI